MPPVLVVLSVEGNANNNRSEARSKKNKNDANVPVVVAGLTFHGKVYLFVNSSQPISNAASLELRLTGKEDTEHIRTDESYGYSEPVPVHVKDSAIFLQKDVPLASFDVGAKPLVQGQYEYPFQATLPYNLFPTLSIPGSGEIRYVLEVHLVSRAGRQDACWGLDGWASTPLIVLGNRNGTDDSDSAKDKKRLGLLRPKSMPTKIESIRSFCCKSGGVMALAGEVDSGLYTPGDTIRVSWKALNRSSCSIRQVSISLHQNVTFMVKKDRKSDWNVIAKQTFYGNQFPELSPRVRSNGDEDPEASLAGQSFHVVSLMIPREDTLQSFHGKLIHVDHVIMVELQTGAMMKSPDVTCGVRIQPVLSHLPTSPGPTITAVQAGKTIKDLPTVYPVMKNDVMAIRYGEEASRVKLV